MKLTLRTQQKTQCWLSQRCQSESEFRFWVHSCCWLVFLVFEELFKFCVTCVSKIQKYILSSWFLLSLLIWSVNTLKIVVYGKLHSANWSGVWVLVLSMAFCLLTFRHKWMECFGERFRSLSEQSTLVIHRGVQMKEVLNDLTDLNELRKLFTLRLKDLQTLRFEIIYMYIFCMCWLYAYAIMHAKMRNAKLYLYWRDI